MSTCRSRDQHDLSRFERHGFDRDRSGRDGIRARPAGDEAQRARGERRRARTIHDYTYNTRRQLELDAATQLGTGIDAGIESIGRSYDSLARLEKVTSYADNDGSGTIENEVQYTYNTAHGKLARIYQSHQGVVDTMSTPNTWLTYDTAVDGSNVYTHVVRFRLVAAVPCRDPVGPLECGRSETSCDEFLVFHVRRRQPHRPHVMIPQNEDQLEDLLSEPPEYLVEAFRGLPGDMIVLGAGGKMGPSLCRMAKRAADAAGTPRRVLAVSRFTDDKVPSQLANWGVEVVRGDLLDRRFISSLPQMPLVVAMTGQKFGTAGAAATTWAMNAYLPALVCEHFSAGRIVAFSSGNIYGLVKVASGHGSREIDPLQPVGEYACSVLGRERIYEHFSRSLNLPVSITRLNYATELRYGVLVDIALRVWQDEPVPIAMGHANVIWQADANAITLASFAHASSPPFVLNVAGPEILRCRDVALRFGELLGQKVTLEGEEAPTALLNDASLSRQLFGPPRVKADELVEWIAHWMKSGGVLWNKPTHYESRDGKF